jgi:predicted ATP-dependent endonuclease of OLD family
MFISKLKIENYRNFRNFEIELQPFTLLIGENNVGKTNLLNAIGLIFSQDISFFKKRMLEIDDINNKIIREFKESIIDNDSKINFPEIKVEVIMEDFNDDQEAVIGDWFINQELEKAKLTYIFHPKTDLSKWLEKQKEIVRKLLKEDSEDDEQLRERKIKKIDFPLKKYGFDIYGGDNLTKRVDYYFLKMLRMEFLDALRDAKKELVASGDYRLLFKILNNRPEDKFEKIKDKLSGLQQEINENPELKNVRNEITEYLKKISLEEEENNYKVDFQISSIETTEILKKLSLIYGNEPITVDRNGLGRNNLLYISLILSHLTNTDSDNNYDVFFRFIGIEEPEAHLQPQLQDHLSMNIKNEIKDEIQILLTSHSSHIASKLKLENTIILYKDDNDIKSHYILKGIEDDKNTVRYIEKYLDATKSIMFFARKLILVEGISEQILIPKFFNLHTDKTLLELGYTIINVNGVAFKHLVKTEQMI